MEIISVKITSVFETGVVKAKANAVLGWFGVRGTLAVRHIWSLTAACTQSCSLLRRELRTGTERCS